MAIIIGDNDSEILVGSGLADTIRGNGGNDTLNGLGGNDRLEGGVGNDSLLGGLGADSLFGGAGNDRLFGGAGNDVLVGGLGRDFLSGGTGADTFRFDDRDAGDVTSGPASDVISDFTSNDLLDLIAVDVNAFAGWGYRQPERGTFSIWQASGSTYVTWNTFGGFHDVELRGFTGGDLYSQIRWYTDDYLASVSTTGRIASGQTRAGTIEVPEDSDWFRTTLAEGRIYSFDVRGEADGGGTLRDPYVQLYDADGDLLAESYEESAFSASLSGTYFVAVTGYGSTGTYQLAMESEADDYAGNAGTTGRIASGQARSGEIQAGNDEDWFRATLTEGQIYTFDVRGEADGGGTLLDPRVILYDAEGNAIAENYEDLGFLAEESGTYYIAAGSYGDVGTYRLRMQTVVDDYSGDTGTAGELTVGETRIGAIQYAGDQDWFSIELTEGETYTIDLRGAPSGSGTLPDPWLFLHDADGDVITSNDDWDSYDSRIVHTASTSGTYFIDARELGSRTGTYEVSVTVDDPLSA